MQLCMDHKGKTRGSPLVDPVGHFPRSSAIRTTMHCLRITVAEDRRDICPVVVAQIRLAFYVDSQKLSEIG